jgi:hypothetical protein
MISAPAADHHFARRDVTWIGRRKGASSVIMKTDNRANCLLGEPTLADALSDPVVRAMMTANKVDAASLASNLRDMALKITSSRAIEGRSGRPKET